MAEAAAQLAVTEMTIRRRIRRGTLQARQEPTQAGFRWLVHIELPAQAALEDATNGALTGTPSDTLTGTPTPESTGTPAIDALAQLTSERDWLRQRVEELTSLVRDMA